MAPAGRRPRGRPHRLEAARRSRRALRRRRARRSSTSSTPTTASSGLPIDKGITPLLIQSGWTDDLFPVGQGLRIYDLLRQKSKTAPVALQLGDLGHSRAANHSADIAAFNAQGLAFFEARLKHVRQGPRARAA